VPGCRDPAAERLLARLIFDDARVLTDGEDERRNGGGETRAEVGGARAALLDRFVQNSGGDHVVVGASVVEQRGDLEWVLDEWSAVGAAPLPSVLPLCVLVGASVFGSRTTRSPMQRRAVTPPRD
jgi:hypothetical protein